MIKLLALVIMLSASVSSFASECANNIESLKALVGNNGLALSWKENTNKNPLYLTLKNGSGNLNLRLKTAKGEWANVTGIICTKGDNYVAKVQNIVWGPEAPGLAKAANIKEIKLKLPYDSLLKVSVSLLSFEFSPAP